jgi:ribonuclease HII
MNRRHSPDSLPLFEDLARTRPSFDFERRDMASGYRRIAGVDEAGRGPLAGPVVAAAVVLNPDQIPDGLNDSKELSAERRESLFGEILVSADVAIASLSADAIDRSDIRKASLEAMRRAVLLLPGPADFALIDGRDVPPGLSCPGRALVKGDARSLSIAAASIVAKVMRDRMMAAAGRAYPGYGFETHAGYGTAAHLDAIRRLGPSPIHRMTFRPLRRE